MFDAVLRTHLERPLDLVAVRLDGVGLRPNHVTATGLAIGVGACVAIAAERWWLGLALWLANRLADGLDGPLARRRGATDFGGLFDIVADFAIYVGVVVALGVALPEARLACLVVLLMYYLSGSSFLAYSKLATKLGMQGDGRSLHFPAGIAEGTETIAAYVVILLFPSQAEPLLWVWAALVGITFLQRAALIIRLRR